MTSKSAKSSGSPQPQNLLDYLCELTRKELDELYTDHFTVMIVFRTLPPLAKQYIMRFISLQSLRLQESVLSTWVKADDPKSARAHQDAIRRLRSLKILIRGTSRRHDTPKETVCLLNPPFRITLMSTLTTTNPLQYHIQTVYHPMLYSSSPPQPLLHTPSSATATNTTTVKPTTSSSSSTITANPSQGSSTQQQTRSHKLSLLASEAEVVAPGSSMTVVSSNSSEETSDQRRSRRQRELETIVWESDTPPLYRGPSDHLLRAYYLTTSYPHKYSINELKLQADSPHITHSPLELPEIDHNFLDDYGRNILDNISRFMLGILPSNRPLSPLIRSLLTKNRLLMHSADLPPSAFSATSAFRGALVPTHEGIQYLLKEPQDRVWLLLLHYFSAVREYHQQHTQSLPASPGSSSSSSSSSPAAAATEIPGIFEVFKFLFHLSFTPLGTGIPLVHLRGTPPTPSGSDGRTSSGGIGGAGGGSVPTMPRSGPMDEHLVAVATPQQRLVLAHLAELGLLYPLHASSLFPDYSKTAPSLAPKTSKTKRGNNSKDDQSSSSSSSSPYDLFKLVNPFNDGIIAYYPTQLVINLSNTIQATSQRGLQKDGAVSDDTSASGGLGPAATQPRRRRRLNLDEHSDDEDNDASSSSSSNTTTISSDGRISSSSSPEGNQSLVPLSETQLAYSSILSMHPDMVKKQRVLIVETTLKVYAFTSDELLLVLLSFFVDLRVKLPNMSVGIITRRSIRRALEYRVSADTILQWLTLHCHPRMIENSLGVMDSLGRYVNGRDYILPIKVKDQINLWSTEKNRLYSCDDVVMLTDFDSSSSSSAQSSSSSSSSSRGGGDPGLAPRSEYLDVMQICYNISPQAIVFFDNIQRIIIVRGTFYQQVRDAIRAYRTGGNPQTTQTMSHSVTSVPSPSSTT